MEEAQKTRVEINNKISSLVKERQSQISELKTYFNEKGRRLYKEIILVNDSLHCLEEVLTRPLYRLKVENLHSLSISLGKVVDLNHSVKTLIVSLKVFEEHENYLKQNLLGGTLKSKSFMYKMFERNETLPLSRNEMLKNKFLNFSQQDTGSIMLMKHFYQALYRSDGDFWTEFNKYLNFQMDVKSKPKENFKLEDFTGKLAKLYYGSLVNYNKFYSRLSSSIDLDYAKVVLTSCDIIFMLYNKLMDKSCHQPNLLDYITKLDNYIYKHFIETLSDDLQKLAEFIAKRETDELMKNLDKLYN